jgi:hypothetical protein
MTVILIWAASGKRAVDVDKLPIKMEPQNEGESHHRATSGDDCGNSGLLAVGALSAQLQPVQAAHRLRHWVLWIPLGFLEGNASQNYMANAPFRFWSRLLKDGQS